MNLYQHATTTALVDVFFCLVFLSYDAIVSLFSYGLWFVPFSAFITFACKENGCLPFHF
jgi:hypothetical protein